MEISEVQGVGKARERIVGDFYDNYPDVLQLFLWSMG